MRIQGFTLIELIMIIIIVGILAAYVAPRFGGSQDAEVVAAQTTLMSMLRLQQQRAMQDTSNPNTYGVSYIGGSFIFVPSGSGEDASVAGININGNWPITFNALGCVESCGGEDRRVVINADNYTRCVSVNEQGYIGSDC